MVGMDYVCRSCARLVATGWMTAGRGTRFGACARCFSAAAGVTNACSPRLLATTAVCRRAPPNANVAAAVVVPGRPVAVVRANSSPGATLLRQTVHAPPPAGVASGDLLNRGGAAEHLTLRGKSAPHHTPLSRPHSVPEKRDHRARHDVLPASDGGPDRGRRLTVAHQRRAQRHHGVPVRVLPEPDRGRGEVRAAVHEQHRFHGVQRHRRGDLAGTGGRWQGRNARSRENKRIRAFFSGMRERERERKRYVEKSSLYYIPSK